MQEESLEFNVAQNTWAGLWKITLGEALQRFEGPLGSRRGNQADQGRRREAGGGQREADGAPMTLHSPARLAS